MNLLLRRSRETHGGSFLQYCVAFLGAPTASRLPRRLYTAEDAAAAPAIECSVCLATFAVGDELRHLPCGHEFHLKCVDAWLLGAAAASADRVSATCPLCKAVPLDVDHLLAEAGAPSATATRDAAR